MNRMIRSILENDLYKFNMCAHILRHFPGTPVTYEFHNRRPEGKFTPESLAKISLELVKMQTLRLSDHEADFLKEQCPYLPPHFIEFLRTFRYDSNQIDLNLLDGDLFITIEGSWETAILWEVPLMAIISEVYFEVVEPVDKGRDVMNEVWCSTVEKIRLAKKAKLNVADFGMRRRYSGEVQDLVVEFFAKNGTHPMNGGDFFSGTSNVYLALKFGVKPIGTMAHELFMGYSVLKGMRHANKHVLGDWANTFQGSVGIALPDTFGTDAFLGDFNGIFSRLYDGVRHDSGCPFKFGEKVIEHYRSINIDPKSKTIVFSDGLNMGTATEINDYFKGRIKTSFGIGTNLTNDIKGVNALNMVVKLWSCDGVPVVKLSDVESKQVGDADALRVANWTFRNKPLDSK